ncbi:MAG: hypothetical protein Ct9H300mP11_26420 [Chloroflexota bacterium]|nr:MAG: hypothetical protein Ct9H300mP11_26420 [Chloroflexota bacterium]
MDMVELQTRIAAGERLPISQDDIRPMGHALECRIYAEDPYSNFAPAVGQLLAWQPPSRDGYPTGLGVLKVRRSRDTMTRCCQIGGMGAGPGKFHRKDDSSVGVFPRTGCYDQYPVSDKSLRHTDFMSGDYDTRFIDKILFNYARGRFVSVCCSECRKLLAGQWEYHYASGK